MKIIIQSMEDYRPHWLQQRLLNVFEAPTVLFKGDRQTGKSTLAKSRRRPGRLLLTSSADAPLLPAIAQSPAGRNEFVRAANRCAQGVTHPKSELH